MLSELLTALDPTTGQLSSGYLFCDKLFLQANSTLAVVQVNRFASSVELMKDASVLFCLSHALINFIVGLYIFIVVVIIDVIYLQCHIMKRWTQLNGIFKSYGE